MMNWYDKAKAIAESLAVSRGLGPDAIISEHEELGTVKIQFGIVQFRKIDIRFFPENSNEHYHTAFSRILNGLVHRNIRPRTFIYDICLVRSEGSKELFFIILLQRIDCIIRSQLCSEFKPCI